MNDDNINKIERLVALKQNGALSDDEFQAAKTAIFAGTREIGKIAASNPSTQLVSVIDDSTFNTTMPYSSLFELAKLAASSLGGKLTAEDMSAGSLQFKFKYGINVTGIRVDFQFRRTRDECTEVVIKGRFGDAFDTTGAAKARARAVLNDIVRRIEAGSASDLSPDADPIISKPASSFAAPVFGEMDVPHRGKSKTTAWLLAFLLGGLGVQWFYLGAWGWGVLRVMLLVLGVIIGLPYLAAFIGVLEGIRFILMKQSNFDATFNYALVKPFSF